jgi:hypothetical protein
MRGEKEGSTREKKSEKNKRGKGEMKIREKEGRRKRESKRMRWKGNMIISASY